MSFVLCQVPAQFSGCNVARKHGGERTGHCEGLYYFFSYEFKFVMHSYCQVSHLTPEMPEEFIAGTSKWQNEFFVS